MKLNQSQISLVQASFAKVAPISGKAAQIFYSRLFELDPSLRKLFKGDIEAQGKKLMSMIAAAVKGLNNLPGLVPVLQNLGRRHTGYGGEGKRLCHGGASAHLDARKGFGKRIYPGSAPSMDCRLHRDCRHDERSRNSKWHNGFDD